MPKGGRKKNGNYQWLPCVRLYLRRTHPKWVSYYNIIEHSKLFGKKMCPSKVQFTMSLRGHGDEFENKIENDIRVWRLKENVGNRRTD